LTEIAPCSVINLRHNQQLKMLYLCCQNLQNSGLCSTSN